MDGTILPILFLASIGISKPFARNKLGASISADEFVVYNSVLMLLLLIIYHLIKYYVYNEPFMFGKYLTDLTSISPNYKIMLFFWAIFTIYEEYAFFRYSSTNNGAKSIFTVRIISSIGIILFGIYAFDRKLTREQIFGILMILVGFFIVQKN